MLKRLYIVGRKANVYASLEGGPRPPSQCPVCKGLGKPGGCGGCGRKG